jgi:hypothetical protein
LSGPLGIWILERGHLRPVCVRPDADDLVSVYS